MRHFPCPRSWLRHPYSEPELSPSQAALAGRSPKPGTKAHLLMRMFASGWNHEEIDLVKQVEAILTPLLREDHAEVASLATALRAEGLPAEVGATSDHPNWLCLALEAVTRHAWWTPCRHVRESIIFVAKNKVSARAASAFALLSAHANLTGTHALTFRRVSLFSIGSPQTLATFMERNGNVDILVLADGALDSDSAYHTLNTLASIREIFDGLIIYEAVPHVWDEREYIAGVAKKSGFSLVVGVGGGGRNRSGIRGQ